MVTISLQHPTPDIAHKQERCPVARHRPQTGGGVRAGGAHLKKNRRGTQRANSTRRIGLIQGTLARDGRGPQGPPANSASPLALRRALRLGTSFCDLCCWFVCSSISDCGGFAFCKRVLLCGSSWESCKLITKRKLEDSQSSLLGHSSSQ